MPTKKPRKATYAKIPDHSDLRGFSYRAPTNYQWSDDHESKTAARPKGKKDEGPDLP